MAKVGPRKSKFNPPLIQFARGGSVSMLDRGTLDTTPPSTRSDTIGPDNMKMLGDGRRYMSGYIIQNTKYEDTEWTWQSGEDPRKGMSADAAERGAKNNPDLINKKKGASILKNGTRYGFQFHYNPNWLEFSIGVSTDVNPSFIFSGKSKSVPWMMPENPGTITVNLTLNRIEDMSFIQRDAGGNAYVISSKNATYKPYGRDLTREEANGILTRGTGYDLEFLFRTLLGREYKNSYGQKTADVGLVFMKPVKIYLSNGMRYSGTISGLNYTHAMFTRQMVPIYTELAFTFTRFPDMINEVQK